MVKANTIINSKTLHAQVSIQIDKKIGVPSKQRVFDSEALANQFIDNQMQLVIRLAIVKFVKQRRFILAKFSTDSHSVRLIDECDFILREMEFHNRSHLVVVMSVVHWLRYRIYAIAPSERSRFRKNYDEIILPIVEHCSLNSKPIRKALN